MEKIYKKDINKVMPILQALAEGKTIQFAVNGDSWIDGNEEGLFLDTLIATPQRYRIKPKSKYRPFANAEECWEEMQKHEYFGWIKAKDASIPSMFMIINSIRTYKIAISNFIKFT